MEVRYCIVHEKQRDMDILRPRLTVTSIEEPFEMVPELPSVVVIGK